MTPENPLERYTILRELGRGAIGAVYSARDRSTGAVVALKVVDPALFSEPNAKLAERFLQNARSAARLRHRNIVRIFDAGEAGGTAFVASELVEGESLRQLLDARPLSIARAIRIFDDIASALAYAHEEGVVHRGVKPSNIIVLREGVAKIGDFGTGQIGEAALRYMSPEQVRRDAVDHRSDLFSLGAVFYEMLTRRTPFEADSPQEIRQNILRAQPPLPSKVNPHVPGALDAIVLRMLAGNPDERFTNARMLLRDLQRIEEELGLGPGASAGTREPKASELKASELKAEPRASVPPRAVEPTLRTAVVNRSPDPAPIPVPEAFHAPEVRFFKDPEPRPEPSSGSGATFLAALALMLAVLSIGLTVILYYSPDLIERLALASGMREAPRPATAPAPSPSAAPAPSPSTAPAPSPSTAPAPSPSTAPAPLPSTAPSPSPAPVAEAIPKPVPAPEPVPAPAPPVIASPPPVASAAKPAEPSGVASTPSPVTPQPLVEEPPSAPEETLRAGESERPATGDSAPTQEAPRVPPPRAKVRKPEPIVMAKLTLAVSPRGELYIDGEHYGSTPPLTTLELEPGMHRIEIRSGSRKPYLTYITVNGGEERRIRHDFNAKSSRPPG